MGVFEHSIAVGGAVAAAAAAAREPVYWSGGGTADPEIRPGGPIVAEGGRIFGWGICRCTRKQMHV